MRIIPFLFLLVISARVFAQPPVIRPLFMFDTYYSTVGDRGADVWGFKGGIELDRKWRFAAGYNRITSDIVEYKDLPASEVAYAGRETVKAQLFMDYFPLMAEYVLYDKDPWQISFPVQAGYGRSFFRYFDAKNNRRRIFEHGVIVNDIAVAGQYRILKWFGAGAGIGYRFMLLNNPEIDTNFNTPVFSLRLKLFLNEIYQSVFHPEEPAMAPGQ
jgi:hypothetical protein